jgi:hypothetical protein
MNKKLMTLIATAGLIFAVQGYAEDNKDENTSVVEILACEGQDHNHDEDSKDNALANDDESKEDSIIANDDDSKEDSIIANDDESKEDSIIANDDESKEDSIIANDDESKEDSIDSILAQCSNGKCPKEMIDRLRREKQIERGETPDDTFIELNNEVVPAPTV